MQRILSRSPRAYLFSCSSILSMFLGLSFSDFLAGAWNTD